MKELEQVLNKLDELSRDIARRGTCDFDSVDLVNELRDRYEEELLMGDTEYRAFGDWLNHFACRDSSPL